MVIFLSFGLFQVFQRCLECLQQENFLTEVDSKKLFANIDEVYETNSKFWNEYLFLVIEEARRTKEPIRPLQFRDSFSKVIYYIFVVIIHKSFRWKMF